MKNLKQSSNIMTIIFSVLIIACNVGIYKYIEKLEKDKCVCSQKFKLVKFIKPASIVASSLILIKLLAALTGTPLVQQKILQNIHGRLITLLVRLFLMGYSVCIIIYFTQLVIDKCECSKKKERLLLLYPVILSGGGVIITILLLMAGVIKSK
jgi:hypothetical protein